MRPREVQQLVSISDAGLRALMKTQFGPPGFKAPRLSLDGYFPGELRFWRGWKAPASASAASKANAVTSKIEALREALRRLLAQHKADGTLPTNARFLFYELVAAGVVPKHATGARRADQNVVDALKSLRDLDEIPWSWIVDETRSIEDYTGYASIADGVDAVLNALRIDPLRGTATRR